ncbi:MAG: thiamine pyrophosphate-binding protein [Pleurocapsa sp. MO_192.B19]|nr:thiamine pyrophosphate-binding protein [Pleurocapsa sp. MO_192.B19]
MNLNPINAMGANTVSDPSIVSSSPLPLPGNESEYNSDNTSLVTVAETVGKMLLALGVKQAFGVSGGAIGPIWAALEESPLEVFHFRHEGGASFAATESYLANGLPVAFFATTGPGITNALTGLFAAKWDGAKVIFLSGATTAGKRGRWACQETSSYAMPVEGILTSGKLFDYATTLESSAQLPEIARRLAIGLAQPGGFVAHLNIPTAVQMGLINNSLPKVNFSSSLVTISEERVSECASLLSEGSFCIWVGFGAREAAVEILQLAERMGAAVMCSPRGKGIFPETHPQFVGVTGIGGHDSVFSYMREHPPLRTLVLGTRLGELTSFWNPILVPSKGFIHVDIDPEVPGVAYPSAETVAIQSDVGLFLKALLKHFPESSCLSTPPSLPRPQLERINPTWSEPVRPEVLLDTIQKVIVEGSDALVMAEAGNTISWTVNRLLFIQPGRYRVSTGWGSMGHFTTGVIGAALVKKRKAVALVGDGAMLMNNEISTAVKYRIPAVWIVFNDSSYNMCQQGMALQGFKKVDTEIPPTNFVQIACGLGADGIRVESEADLEAALETAMAANIPFVVDVVIDHNRLAPIGGRVKSLSSQGAAKPSSSLWE